MNTSIDNNYSRLRALLFFLPVFLLTTIALLLYSRDAFCVNEYIQIQKSSFLYINHSLGQYPNLQFNLTQIGDCMIFLSFLGILIVYAPKIWESLIAGLLVSFLLTVPLKKIFAIPRPAAVFDNNSFVIIGKKLSGFNSFPSGHSITVFTVLTVLLFAFMPQKLKYKIIWSLFVVITGLILAFSRVGVGAHYPIDVIAGSIIGYISGLAGVFISREYKIWAWVNNKKYYPFFIVLFLICCIILFYRMINENLTVFYLSFISLVISLYKIIDVYAKKVKK
ncbi:MAG: phosphatase PAP2 family protein [Chitinophagaceae bacterium]|nr:phosphatase PAP2 family protein [Chitinophagaceae bacterium]MCW5929512.1 phosphatase PAP2 family protein [Chitinophagaceae bacterium]